jgi:hypothetical protein
MVLMVVPFVLAVITLLAAATMMLERMLAVPSTVVSFALVFEMVAHIDAVVVKPLLMWEVDPKVELLHQVVACIVVVVDV